MDLRQAIDELKFRLSGDILETELGDEQFTKVLNISLRELQRYLDSTTIVTVPYSNCIDFNSYKTPSGKFLKINSVSRVYRAAGLTSGATDGYSTADPMYIAQWQLLGGVGNLYNYQDYLYNYMAYNSVLQTRNTVSTDLNFIFDRSGNKLYINIASNYPDYVTIEYIPILDGVEDLISDFWIDVLMRLAVANTKIIVGRIRSKFTSSNLGWTSDGKDILSEGNSELSELRQYLQKNTNLIYPMD